MENKIMNQPISVKIEQSENLIKVFSDTDCIEIYNVSDYKANLNKSDFAAWLFLPIAMSLGRDIVVDGVGSFETVKNFRILSEIWESWDLDRFSSVDVSFKKNEDYVTKNEGKSLAFYSGGVDSTYSLLKQNSKKDALLTVHGMDYRYNDDDRFEKLKRKTDSFAKLVGNDRIFVTSNVYDIYGKYKINTRQSHASHIFALAGLSFLFSEQFNDIVISSDYRLDQQYLVHPWGSNSATNKYFSDGCTKLITLDDDVTRSEKLPLLVNNEIALHSLSFCVDYSHRPENCGVCSKCMRTKLMFQAVCGYIPDVFKDKSLDEQSIKCIKLKKNSEVVFFLDLYNQAKKYNRLGDIPKLQEQYLKLKTKKKIDSIKLKLKNLFS